MNSTFTSEHFVDKFVKFDSDGRCIDTNASDWANLIHKCFHEIYSVSPKSSPTP